MCVPTVHLRAHSIDEPGAHVLESAHDGDGAAIAFI